MAFTIKLGGLVEPGNDDEVLTTVSGAVQWKAPAGGGAATIADLLQPIAGLTVPVDADYAWINQGTATVTVGSDSRIFLKALAAAGHTWKIRKKAAPATPYTVTAGFSVVFPGNLNSAGICFRESGTGKLYIHALRNIEDILTARWTNATTFSATVKLTSDTVHFWSALIWLRLEDDGTTLKFYYSSDGENFIQWTTNARTAFMAGGPDEIGFCVNSENTGEDCGMTLIHWAEA